MGWSLYKRKADDSGIGTGLFNYTGEKMEPLKFSNGKTQEDVVNEVMDAIGAGNKIIFIKGVCGSGKSAMALNIAKNFKKSSIIVPIKSLQEQYEIDYTQKMFITKDDGNPLKISVIKGRNNFSCVFGGDRADDPTIPCTIEIREKNTEALLEYIEQNPCADREDFSSATDVKRMNIAPACPYWAPIMPSEINPKGLGEFTKKKYDAIAGVEYAVFKRKKGCPFYDQYDAYADSDVLIFNSMKYLIETEIGRKPKTDIEIIDECDEFLDNFANEKKINMNRLQQSLVKLMPQDQKDRAALKEILNDINSFLFNPEKIEIQKLPSSKLYPILEKILKAPNLASEEELNYYNNVVDIARSFEKLLDETYIATDNYSSNGVKPASGQQGLFGSKDDYEEPVVINLVSINLASKLHELIEANKVLVMMSGTLHSEEVLRDIFGLDKFKVIEAETENPGEIKKQRTGLERNCSYANFQNETITRKMYLKIMDLCLANAKSPTLVHVNAFKDLPTEEENEEWKFDNLITQERLRELQKFGNSAVDEFTNKESDVLFTTKCSRGIDFAGDKCNSIIVTRFPYPNVQGLFWKILKQEQPDKFMEFYLDKSRRDLVQKIARGVRFKGDMVDLWSPDVRVLNGKL
ncbi:DEAD/DEAH box helicase family protein [archaeon]|jgi:Rad3-related DNA helicase|nr:DEAD/DEAH box helicase family protein [archaeon]MBT6183022.1 DEAD/DEAH box helicase family protein [archaeon]MBT6606510.1 DEAD/DEAH box helicase family protein [archaeon]MBT7251325.1 DEAD/DEAH box helicase family protein [archaeon]MBT7661040.1 DEAD/DEAH box helicase family protein [archaeon]